MILNLILSVNYPINWGPVIRATHSHQPDLLNLIHIPREGVTAYTFEIPENLSNWFDQHGIEVSFNILNDGEKLEYPTEHCMRLDALSGATFSQVKLIESLPDNLEVWATSSAGIESVRLDDEGTISFPLLDPLEGLRLMGQDSSFKKVEPIGFDLTILEPYILHKYNYAWVNHYALRRDFKSDSSKEKLFLTDSNNNELEFDRRDGDGFWLEDVIMEYLANEYSQKEGQVYRNYMINRDDVEEQFLSGLDRMLGNHRKQIMPRQRLNIAECLGIDPWRYRPKSNEYNSIISEITMDMFTEMPKSTYQEILDAGSVNEFDAVLIEDNKITTIEVKSSRPWMFMVAKLTTLISKHLTPLKKKGLLIHGYDPEGEDLEEFENELELWSKLFPDIEVIAWFDLVGLSPPKTRHTGLNKKKGLFVPRKKEKNIKVNDGGEDEPDVDLLTLKMEIKIHNKVLRFLTFVCPDRVKYFKGIIKLEDKWYIEATSERKIGRLIGKDHRSILEQLSQSIPEIETSKVFGNKSYNY
jgi:hypothetical protein